MKKLLTLTLVLGVFLATSCKKDEKSDPPTPDEVKTTMSGLDESVSTDLNEAMSSEGIDAVFSAMNVLSTNNPLLDQKKKSGNATGEFVFSDHAGTYTWNESKEDFDFEASPADKIIFKLPADSNNMSNNNMVATVSDLSMDMYIDEYEDCVGYDSNGYCIWGTVQDTNWIPTSAKASVLIDGEEIIVVDYSGTFDDEQEPTMLDAYLKMVPMELSLSFSDNGSKMSVTESFKVSGRNVLAAKGDVSYIEVMDPWDDDTWDSTYYIEGYLQYSNIKIQGSINEGEIAKLEEENPTRELTADEVNQNVTLSLYEMPDNHKMADVEFYDPQDTAIEPVRFKLTDGSYMTWEEVIEPIIEDINTELATKDIDPIQDPDISFGNSYNEPQY